MADMSIKIEIDIKGGYRQYIGKADTIEDRL